MVTRDVLRDSADGWPKTSGSRASTSTAGSSALDVHGRCAAPWRSTRGRAARARHRTSKWWKEERTASSSTTTRTPRTARWPPRTPSADARRARLHPADVGRGPDRELEAFTDRHRARPVRDDRRPRRADRRTPGSLEALLELAARDEPPASRRRLAPHYEKQTGEAPRVQPRSAGGDPAPREGTSPAGPRQVERPHRPAPDDRAAAGDRQAPPSGGAAGLERWRARHPAASGHLEPSDVLVDAMRGPARPGRASAST